MARGGCQDCNHRPRLATLPTIAASIAGIIDGDSQDYDRPVDAASNDASD